MSHAKDQTTPTAELPAAFEMPRDRQMSVRIPSPIHNRMKELATYHGRSVSDHVVFALYLLDLQMVLNELQHPEAKKELGAKKHREAVEEVTADLAEAMQAALNPERPKPKLNLN